MQVVLARRTKLELSDALDPLILLASLQVRTLSMNVFCAIMMLIQLSSDCEKCCNMSVVLRCSTLNCSISKWVVCCKIVQEKDPNAYQFCLQLPDGSAFIGSTVSSQYTHTHLVQDCALPPKLSLCVLMKMERACLVSVSFFS